MRRIERNERRALLVRRQFLDRSGSSMEDVAGGFAGLHSSDPASVYLATWARVRDISPEDIADSLYDDRSVVRLLGMRRTMFVVPVDFAPTIDAATTRAYAPAQRRRLAGWVIDSDLSDDGDRWIDDVGGAVVEALSQMGPSTARELTAVVPELASKLTVPGGTIGASTRVLFLLAIEGAIVRGRPRGSWVSSQYEWSRVEDWLGEALDVVDPVVARTELMRRWLSTFGPATERDCAWWTGWTLRDTRAALDAIGAEPVQLEEGSGFVVPDHVGQVDPVTDDDVALLPGLDPSPMGWKERDWFLGPHQGPLFDANGNIGPTVWAGGRIVGGWGHASDGTVVVRLLEPVASSTSDAIDERAAELSTWLGDIRVKARFPTPMEKEIRSG